ncbi:MAG: NADPH-dependent oxidoreductase [Rickettsiales bacterium]|nr:NADPH-dependent oxidoreductase [Rickettsiales bacterium]|tara:strand:- start:327 stop:839 length:513 start_codon:yes stop_codon:yes gene_type:complete
MLLICAASSGDNLKLAAKLKAMAIDQGLDCELIDLSDTGLPLYSRKTDSGEAPQGFAELHALFQRARGYIFCAPEYNGSMPPAMTNAIAWLSVASQDFRALFNGRPVAIATHSGGSGAKLMVAMRLQLGHLGANVLGRELFTNKNRPLSIKAAESVLEQLAAQMLSHPYP